MRTAFVKTLTDLASQDKNVWLLTGDLGFSVFEDFIKRFPNQYLNGGVAEQNLISMAAGAAMAGKKVFVYSISTFASMRPFEQIRNDVCYQNLPVFIMAGGSTFSYSTFGCTHMPLEDLAIMRVLPNMAVTCPGDPMEVEILIKDIYRRGQPAYMRMAKKGEPVINRLKNDIGLGKISVVKTGHDAVIIVTGRQLPNAVSAAQQLQAKGINCGVLSVHTLKPLDVELLVRSVKQTKAIVTVEEHSIIGGLGSAVAEVLVDYKINVPFKRLGVTDKFPAGAGSQEFMLKHYHLTADGITTAVKRLL